MKKQQQEDKEVEDSLERGGREKEGEKGERRPNLRKKDIRTTRRGQKRMSESCLKRGRLGNQPESLRPK